MPLQSTLSEVSADYAAEPDLEQLKLEQRKFFES